MTESRRTRQDWNELSRQNEKLRQENDHGFQLPLYGGWKFFIFPASLREETGFWFKKERKGTEMSTVRRKDFFS